MKLSRFAVSALAVAAVIWFFSRVLPANTTTVALALLLVILGISARWGLGEAIFGSVLAVLGFNYYFLPPVGAFTVEDPQNWVALFAFLVTAATASQLSARARRRTAESEDRRRELERLYALVQGVMLSGNPRRIVGEYLGRVVELFGVRGAAFYSAATDEVFRSGPESNMASDHDLQVAAEMPGSSLDDVRGLALSPVRLGSRPMGSLALIGAPPSEAVVRAISDLIAISMERARALEEASYAEAMQQSEQLKGALLDALAHDIKTPLTSIKAAATSLLGQAHTSGETELLTIINEETDRLTQLAAEMIAMARIEAGKLHLERRAVNVDDLLSDALSGIHPAWTGRALRVEVEPALPPVEADPEFVHQVLKQLLDNALKYSPETSPVLVTAKLEDARIVIGVADRGSGIEENERARIFEKYFRGRRHRFETKGTGMGLPIAKGIVEAHRGRIWVESEPGQGSVFYFSLPLYEGEAEA